jgi:sulfate adenylyltransferase
MITPHGGKLINLYCSKERKAKILSQVDQYPKIILDEKNLSDLELLASGAFSPLTGFMKKEDYRSVVEDMHLENGIPWTLPITLAVGKDVVKELSTHDEVILLDQSQKTLAILHIEDIFQYDKRNEVKKIFGTDQTEHPGVHYVYQQGENYLGGSIQLIEPPQPQIFNKYRLNPSETRKAFKERGWLSIVGFQTRNPIHRAHEYLQKCALEMVDGLLIHPLIGQTKADDISAEIRLKSYEILLEKYYPKDRVMMAVFPAAMRYAGPREAIFHAIIRKNYGCTHIIIGRDHAGVGNYYGSYDAQEIFKEFPGDELEITPIFFEHAFYCRACNNMASTKTCPHDIKEHMIFSGTEIRQKLLNGIKLPPEFTRPEVAEVLVEGLKGMTRARGKE